MSRSSDVEEETGEELGIGQPTGTTDGDADAITEIEAGLAELADDMGRLLERAPVAEREALHDYAVSLVRDKLPTVSPDASAASERAGLPTARGSATSGVHLIGYGLLLLPVAFLMMLVFAPLGTILLAGGVALLAVGLVGGLLGRLRAT